MEPWITYQTSSQEAMDTTHTRPTTNNLPYSQANSASYPQRDEKQIASSTMRCGTTLVSGGQMSKITQDQG